MSQTMETNLKILRITAAACILTGGSMHLLGLIKALAAHANPEWWLFGVYGVAIPGYLASSVAIMLDRRPGFWFTLAAPQVGGLLIFLGFLFPDSRLLMLIPGTLENEITLMGFFTLLTEPIAVAAAGMYLLFTRDN